MASKVLKSQTAIDQAFAAYELNVKAPVARVALAEAIVKYVSETRGTTGESVKREVLLGWAQRERKISEALAKSQGRTVSDKKRDATDSENIAVFNLGNLPGGLRAFNIAKATTNAWFEMRKCAQRISREYRESAEKATDREMPSDKAIKALCVEVCDKQKQGGKSAKADKLCSMAMNMLVGLRKKLRNDAQREKVDRAIASLKPVHTALVKPKGE
jgi:hypothetical protein